MALSAPTSLSSAGAFASTSSGGSGHGTGAFTNSIIVPDNCILVVEVAAVAFDSAAVDTNMTVAWNSLSLTRRANQSRTDPEGTVTSVSIWALLVTSGATANLVVDCGAVDLWSVKAKPIYFTGHDTGAFSGVTAAGFEDPASGAVGITLSGAPASSSQVVACIGVLSDSLNITPGTGWTEIDDFYGVTTGDDLSLMQFEIEHRTGSTSTSVSWNAATSGFGLQAVACAVEIKEAAAGGGGRIVRKLAGHGGLAGPGGLAGRFGGLAG